MIPERAHDGSEPWGNNSTSAALLQFPAVGTKQWVDWMGRWGNEADGNSAEFPPASPGNQQPHFNEPWISTCEGGKCYGAAFASGRRKRLPSLSARSALVPVTASDAGLHVPASRSNEYCANWFGADVQALLCDPEALAGSLATMTMHPLLGRGFARRQGSRTSATRAIAQAVGRDLVPGDTLRVRGGVGQGAVLFVRARDHGHRIRVRFAGLHLSSGESRLIQVTSAHGWPVVELVMPDGKKRLPREVERG